MKSKWNELSLKEALVVNAALSMPNFMLHDRRAVIAQVLSGRSMAEFAEGDKDIQIEAMGKWMEEWADPFFNITEDEDGKRKYEPRLGLTRCHYPEIEFETHVKTTDKRLMQKPGKMMVRRSLFACADAWENMTVYELGYVWSYLDAFGKSGDEQYLRLACGVIWRFSRKHTAEEEAAAWNGDRRRPLYREESSIEMRAEMFKGVAGPVMSLIYFWMVSCRQAIIDQYPVLFDRPTSNLPDQEGKPDFGWPGLLIEVAGGIVELEKVANHNWSTFFIYLAKMEHDRQAQEFKSALRVE